MAQVNVVHFAHIDGREDRVFARLTRNVVAEAIHGLKISDIRPTSVSVLVVPVNKQASFSGADTEVQVLVSGNNWPANAAGRAASAAEAKIHFDSIAARIHASITKESRRNISVWVTPFVASGWAESEKL